MVKINFGALRPYRRDGMSKSGPLIQSSSILSSNIL